MSSLRFRLPGRQRSIAEWLSILLPLIDRATRQRWIEARNIHVDGQPVDRASMVCMPGARVEIAEVDARALAPKPPGKSTEWFAWVDEPPWFGGELKSELESAEASNSLRFRIEERLAGLARISLSGPALDAGGCARVLAASGMPVVGDLENGGLAHRAGVAIATTPGALAAFDNSLESPWPEPASAAEALTLQVSQEAAQALDRGHPWVLPDDASDSAAKFRPGSEIRVEDRSGRVLGWAWSGGNERISARMSAHGDVSRREILSIEARVARALARRRELMAPIAEGPATNCFRLIHGEADGLPGLFVDRLGPLLRIFVTTRATDGFRARAIDALLAQWPLTPEGVQWSAIELLHLRTGSRSDAFDRVRWIVGGPDALAGVGVDCEGSGFWVEERGLRFWVDPGWDSPRRTRPGFGLFGDQRENRARLASLAARGGRWLNLFAHTGAFSVALLAAGADEVISVDLSAPYLARLDANLEANRDRGVDPNRHRSMRGEGRHSIESMNSAERFAGIVLDPPTAASAGRRFWSVRRDLEPLLRLCMGRLEPEGTLLVTQNGRGVALGLDGILERIASRADRRVRELTRAGPGSDYPTLARFPEGDAFEGWLVQLEG